jgi:hypothetical protein
MRPTFIIAAAAGFAALSILSGPAWALVSLASRTFVSGHGSDSNPCTLAAPCRSFAQALTQTSAGGEIAVLDTAGYGTVTINKSVSIVSPGGVEAGVTTASAIDAITVSIGASDVVNLRGLTLVGGGVGTNGINFGGLGMLNIQDCAIRGFGNGIAFAPSGTAALNVSDTSVSNITQEGIGIVPPAAGTVTAAYNRVQVTGAGDAGFTIFGFSSFGTVKVTIANSVATNSTAGIGAIATASGTAQVMVSNSVVSNNATGINATGANATIFLARNTIAGNTTAFATASSGVLSSFGDNDIKSNGDDGGAIPLVQTK